VGSDDNPEDVTEMFQTLAKAVIGFMEEL